MKSKTIWLPLLSCLVFPLVAQGKSTGVETRLTSAKIVETTPGKILTASFLVSNLTDRDEEFIEQIALPEGWRKIAPEEIPFTAKAKNEAVRLLALAVPATFPAGRYEITYGVVSRRDAALTDSGSFSAVVLPVAKLELVVEDKPEMVVAGDEYEARLRVINRGNSETRILLTMKSSSDYQAKADRPDLILLPGSAQVLRIKVKTDPALRQKATHVLSVKATAAEQSGEAAVSASQSIGVEVIPKITGDQDPYVRLPARLRFTGTAEDGTGGGFQAEFSGAGNLDEAGKHKIDFLFRGPDLQDKSIFGLRDEYRVSIFTPVVDVHAGDRNFTLSPLTERYGYGRGLQVDIHPGPTGVGAFYMKSRWRTDNFSEAGAYLKHDFSPTFGLRGNFLHKDGHSLFLTNGVPANIYSIQPRFSLGKNLTLDLEYAVSDSEPGSGGGTDAYRAEFRGELWNKVNYTLERVHADPKFYGYYSDSDATHASLTFPIYRKLRGSFAFNQYDNNLELDLQRSSVANRETIYRPALLYTFPFGTDLSAEYQNIRREDALLPAAYDFLERSVRVGLGHSFGKISLQTFLERGELHDFLLKQDRDVERYSVYAFYRPTPRQTYSVFTTLGTSRFTSTAEQSETFGATANWQITKSLSANMQYAKNRYVSLTSREQDTAYATLSYTFANKHNMALTGRWAGNSTTKDTESSVLVSYSIPIGLPVGRKKSIARIEGNVFLLDGDKRRPLPRVILMANKDTAVTDRNGAFIFPSLQPGVLLLQIQQSSIGPGYITSEPLPGMVEARKGKTTTLDIHVLQAAGFSARMAIFAAPSRISNGNSENASQSEFVEIGRLEAGLVELSNGKETLHRLTDRHGVVSFDHLRPGRWTVRLYENNIPPFHRLETAEIQIELNPGEAKESVFRILPAERPIKFIDQGVIRQ